VCVCVCAGCFISNVIEYFIKYKRYGKMFQMKVVRSEGMQILVKLIFEKNNLSRSYRGYGHF